jgi:chemotaxis protein methyltransferase CheR
MVDEGESQQDTEAIEVRLLLEAIHAGYGYDLRDYAPGSMRRRVRTALASSGLSNLGELQHKVLTDRAFFATVLDRLTVRVSELFRDPSFHRAFRQRLVPVLRTYPLLKIWHAGCASGEEVYASAITLTEEGLYDRAQIYATDLSHDALEQARHGIYSAAQLTKFASNYEQSGGTATLSTYYTEAYDRIAMRESLRRNVVFFQHNLVSDHVFGEMNVIVCRNVLIYFGPALKERVLHKFEQSLAPRGFLCLGSSEQLAPHRTGNAFADFDSADRIYRRET